MLTHTRRRTKKQPSKQKANLSVVSKQSAAKAAFQIKQRKMSKFTVQKRKKYLCTDTIESQKYNKQRTRILQGFV